MNGRRDRGLEQAKRLEMVLVRVRWFGVILAVYLITQVNQLPPPHASDAVLVSGLAVLAGLAGANLLIRLAVRRPIDARALARVGFIAFVIDAGVLTALSWLFSYDPKGATWVVLTILPLEGAIRYGLGGALASAGFVFAGELGREVYLAHRFSEPGVSGGVLIDAWPFLFSNVAFRGGIAAIVALVAGFMSRSLAREAERAADQAARFEEAARREASARRELAAFNTAILTGVAAEDLDVSLQLMAGAIGRDLGFETMGILLREGDDLVAKGIYGMPFYEERVPITRGVTGHVARTGRPIVVNDVSTFPDYIMVDPDVRSEMAAPMRVGEEVIGVLDVESRSPEAFDEAQLGTLARLADQIALVTHSNQLLSQQRQTMERLQELDQMKSDFVAITSHELRTPLTAIRGFVKTLIKNSDRVSAEQLMDFMQIIDRQSTRLTRLVEDLLLVSRIEAGAIRLQPEEVDLERFMHEALESYSPESRARIQLSVGPNGSSVVMDPDRVDQILRNLLDNALKFSPADSPVRLEARVGRGTIRLVVADRGAGIPEDQLPYVFERFHQAGEVLTREAEGAGLGLYITKRLVEAMDGSIEVRSMPGVGSSFAVTIPWKALPDPPVHHPDHRSWAATRGSGRPEPSAETRA